MDAEGKSESEKETVAVVISHNTPPAATEIIITLPLSEFPEQESVSVMSESFTS